MVTDIIPSGTSVSFLLHAISIGNIISAQRISAKNLFVIYLLFLFLFLHPIYDIKNRQKYQCRICKLFKA